MDNEKPRNRVIPEGEISCIWVEAGLISYKLCDRFYECDDCPFDQVMRKQSRPASKPMVPRESGSDDVVPREKTVSNREILESLIDGFFKPLSAAGLPVDRMYSMNHVWLMRVDKNLYRLGLDHYAAGILESAVSVILPPTGSSSTRNNPLAWLICEDGTIAVRSPISGRVTRSNAQLKESAAQVRKDPYGTGWISELEVADEGGVTKECLNPIGGERAYTSQFEEIRKGLLEEHGRNQTLGTTLLDGGTRLRTLRDFLGPQRFIAFLQKILSAKI